MTEKEIQIYYAVLWQKFEDFIALNWKKEFTNRHGKGNFSLYSYFGEHRPLKVFLQSSGKTNFLKSLRLMLMYTVQNLPEIEVPSEDTLTRTINAAMVSPRSHKSVLRFFLFIAGYQSMSELIKAMPLTQKNVYSLHEMPAAKNKPDIEPGNKKHRPIVITGISLVLFLGILLFYWYRAAAANDKDIEKIRNVIQAENQMQFNAYKKIPLIDTSFCNQFFTASAIAKNDFLGPLFNAKRQNRVLDTLASGFQIHAIYDFKFITDTSCELHTKETWRLAWIDYDTKRQLYKFDTTNIHTYTLEKIEGIWKVAMDKYEGAARKVEY